MSESRLFEILESVLDLDPSDRLAYVDAVCGNDPGLHKEVWSMFEALEESTDFLALPSSSSKLPESIGGYRVVRTLGQGAMGMVYLAEDASLRRQIAIKTLSKRKLGGSSRYTRLREEALTLASLTHPNVAHVYSFEEGVTSGEIGGGEAFITMEYVPGSSLADRLREGPLAIAESLHCGWQIAAALEAAHEKQIVHRDLKPANIRITPEDWVKVLDFGLACLLPAVTGRSKSPGKMLGTPGYMSPEQVEGDLIDTTSDLWSFGCILYECITGTAAIDGGTVHELTRATLAPSIDWSRLGNDVPNRVKSILEQCLEVESTRRSTSATAIRRVLDEELLRLRSGPLIRRRRALAPNSEKGNLPRLPAEFIGREDTLDSLDAKLQGHRLVTITGPGGAGKTRTALELAGRVQERFPDGIWFVDLTEGEDGSNIADTVARCLNLTETKEPDAVARLQDSLQNQLTLLILDNCEHRIEEAADFTRRILEIRAEFRVLATSREPLALPGEQVCPLPAMNLPEGNVSSDEVRQMESLRLFESRAKARNPAFEFDDKSTPLVSEICRKLDGLPLAIELAAGHTRTLPLDQIARRIEDDYGFLSARDRSQAVRHRSIRELIDWSYQLLSTEERRLFARLAIFRGGWDLVAAEAVCADDRLESWQVCEALGRLVDKSLVEAETRGSSIRYRFLETVRDFAADLLRREKRPVGGADSLDDRYVAFWTAESAPQDSEQGLTDSSWLVRMRADYLNLRHALDLALVTGRLESAMQLGVSLGRYLNQSGYWREGIGLLQKLLHDAGSADPDHRILVLAHLAQMAALLDDFRTAEATVSEGMALADRRPNSVAKARMLGAAATTAYYQAELERSQELHRECERLYRQLGDKAGLAATLADLGRLHSVQGNHTDSQPLYRESLRLHRELGDRLGIARVLVNLGRTASLLGQDEEALDLMKEALEAHRTAGDDPGTALCLQNLGEAIRILGRDIERARFYLIEALRIRERTGQIAGVCALLVDYAYLEEDAGNVRAAARLLGGVVEAHEVYGLLFYDGVRARVKDLRQMLEDQIGSDAVSVAWEKGRRTGLKDLVRTITQA